MPRSSALEKERRLDKAAPSREEIIVERRYVIKDKVEPTMKGIVDYGAGGTFASFNAKCKHLGCTALWRKEQEAAKLVPVDLGHDIIVCPCHLGTYNIYNSAKVMFGPPPQP